MTTSARWLAALVAPLTLAGCGGTDPQSTPPDGPRETVYAYSQAYLGGHGGAAHALLSTRCKKLITEAEMITLAGLAKQWYGPQPIATYDEHVTGEHAKVTYTYTVDSLNQKDQPWVRESGAWRNDNCPTSTPSADASSTPVTPSTPEATRAPDTAGSIAKAMRRDLTADVTAVKVWTEENDPNSLMGRPGQYTSSATLVDRRTHRTATDGVDAGATVEMFASRDDAERRAEYVESFNGGILGTQYATVYGFALLRVTGELPPAANRAYVRAFRRAVDHQR
jgi:hypothetical protein